MDAVEYVKQCRRMTANDVQIRSVLDGWSAEAVVEQVEQWTKEHPVKTRQSEFLKQWPEVTVDKHGVCNLEPCNLCPSMLNSDGCSMSNCDKCRRDFWLKEIE